MSVSLSFISKLVSVQNFFLVKFVIQRYKILHGIEYISTTYLRIYFEIQ